MKDFFKVNSNMRFDIFTPLYEVHVYLHGSNEIGE